MLAIAATTTGLATASLLYILADILLRPRVVDRELGVFEEQRRVKLRAQNATYRWFEPWIDQLARGFQGRDAAQLTGLAKGLVLAGLPGWRPTEYLATRRIEAILAAVGAGIFGWALGGWLLVLPMAVGGFMLYEQMSQRLIASKAIRRRITIKRRLAAAIDVMALMMEVGGGFQDSLQVAAEESKGTPLGDELALVQRDIDMGRLRKEALREFAERVDDEDVSEIVMALVEGEELGTPLADILRTQAEQMRQKRTQWAEKAAEESQVALVFPAMLIMLACLITVVAPFILGAFQSSGSF